jgi:hypothetical protein
MMTKILSSITVTAHGGVLHRVLHPSAVTMTDMIFSIFLPSSYKVGSAKAPLPAICK